MTEISLWGKGEEITLETIKDEDIEGRWLDLGAGDGRYIPELLPKLNELVLADIDAQEIQKALGFLSGEQKKKIRVKIFDMNEEFPFRESTFEGIFCTGTLHLFPKEELEFIFKEMDRVLKPKGKMIVDFATDVKRVLPNGEKASLTDKPEYTLNWKKNEVRDILKDILRGYNLEFKESSFSDDLTKYPGYGFVTEGSFFLVVANKK